MVIETQVRAWYIDEYQGLLKVRFESGPIDNANYSEYQTIKIDREKSAKLAEVFKGYAESTYTPH